MSIEESCWKCANLRSRIEAVAISVGVRPKRIREDLQELASLEDQLKPGCPMSQFPKTRKALETVIKEEELRLADLRAKVISALIEKLPYILWDWAIDEEVEE